MVTVILIIILPLFISIIITIIIIINSIPGRGTTYLRHRA